MIGCPHPGTGTPCPSCIEEQFGDDERDPFGYLREDEELRTDGGGRYYTALRAAFRRLDGQLATDGGAVTAATPDDEDGPPACERCRQTIPRTPGRFTFRLYDGAESSGSLLAGRLCSACWDDLVAYLNGAQVREPGHPSLRADGGAVMASTPEADGGREWMGGGGVVADRTNELIDTLVESMNAQGVRGVGPGTIDEVARRTLPIGTEDTAAEYRRRAIEYGPFHLDGAFWALDEEYWTGGRR